MATKSKEKLKSSDEEIIRIARERFKLCEDAEQEIRKDALDDLKFRAGEQWFENIKADRTREERPCLTINKIPQFVRQITNDQRQNRPSIKVNPVDDKADIETAKILQGIIRHIEYNSNADIAYDTAFEGAVIKGFGFYRIITDYVSPESFEQEILIKPILNHFSVYLDPNAKEPDGSDAEYGFIFEDVPKDLYKLDYDESDLATGNDWGALSSEAPSWVSDSTCRIAEYYYKDYKDDELLLLESGDIILKSKLDKMYPNDSAPEGFGIKDSRKTRICTVKHCKINGIEILEQTDWLGQHIPIIPVYGDTLDIDGKIIREGIVRHAKDSQRMFNLWASTEAEVIGLTPKAPWIVAEGQITNDQQSSWATANSKTHAYLQYKPTSVGGQPIGPPQRNIYEPPIQAISGARAQASDDIKATTGIFDSSLGAQGNEVSGKAIERRNQQSQTSNFHFVDNQTRSLKHTGVILVEIVPKVYDTARAARIIGEDGQQEIVRLNEMFEKNGQQITYDLGSGKYDVAVQTGPSYQTKRQEAAAAMIDFTKAMPQQAAVISDLMVRNMDWPGAEEIAERLKKTLPPGMAEEKEKQPMPPEAQAQMQQMDQMIQQLTEHLNEANDKIKTKSLELESKERIAMAGYEVDLLKEQMKAAPQQGMQAIINEIAHLNARMEMVGMNRPIDTDFNENEQDEQGPDQAMPEMQEQQQPTGGNPPGQPVGV